MGKNTRLRETDEEEKVFMHEVLDVFYRSWLRVLQGQNTQGTECQTQRAA
jgi:hypothetical protein